MTERTSLTLKQGVWSFVFHASRALVQSTSVGDGERCGHPGKMLPFGPEQFSVLLSPTITTNGRGMHQPEVGI